MSALSLAVVDVDSSRQIPSMILTAVRPHVRLHSGRSAILQSPRLLSRNPS